MAHSSPRFQWVKCQLDSLRDCHSPAELYAALDGLPETLEETYERILHHISPKNIEKASKILNFICAKGPYAMEPAPLIDLLSRDPVTHKFDPGFRLRSPTDLIGICRSLIKIEDNDSLRKHSYQAGVVQFSHRSVEEYLLGEKSSQKPPAPFLLSMRSANAALGETCIQFLLQFHHNLGHAGFLHARGFWIGCVRLADSPELEQLSLQLFDDESVFRSWCHFHPAITHPAITHPAITHTARPLFDPAPLFYAASFGADWVCKSLILKGANIEETAPDGTNALVAALQTNQLSTLRLLINHGANVDIEGRAWDLYGRYIGSRITPLEYAIYQCCSGFGMTSDLINAILDARPKLRRNSAFISAAGLAYSGFVRKFLAQGVDPDVAEKGLPDGKRALTVAAWFGRVENVRLLLEHGAQVDRRMAPFPGLPATETALTTVITASLYKTPEARGRARICFMLLQNGADLEPVLQQLASRRDEMARRPPDYIPAVGSDIVDECDELDKVLTKHLRDSNMDQYRRFRSLTQPWYVQHGGDISHESRFLWPIGWYVEKTPEP